MAFSYLEGSYRAVIMAQGFAEPTPGAAPEFWVQMKVCAAYDEQRQLVKCTQAARKCCWPLGKAGGVRRLRVDLAAAGVAVADLAHLAKGAPGHIDLAAKEVDVYCRLDAAGEELDERWAFGGGRALGLAVVRRLQKRFARVMAEAV